MSEWERSMPSATATIADYMLFRRLLNRNVLPRTGLTAAMPPIRRSARTAAAPVATPAAATVAAASATSTPKGRKRKAETKSKEEVTEDKSEDAEESTPAASSPKKTKKTTDATSKRKPTAGGIPDSPSAPTSSKSDTTAHASHPKNVSIPSDLPHISSSRRGASTIRLATWNIVSLKSSEQKGLTRYLEAEDADIVFLAETKVNEVPGFFMKTLYPHQTWGIGAGKGYAGVALLSKIEPVAVTKGLPGLDGYDTKGRCVIVEFKGCYVVGTYCVNAGEGLKTIGEKQRWNEALSRYINSTLDVNKPIIWTGDLNVVLDERDLSKAGTKWNKSAGYTQIECDHHRCFLSGTLDGEGKPPAAPITAEGQSVDGQERTPTQHQYTDLWRHLHPDADGGHFTYYGWRGQCRIKGAGWRLDTFIVSQRILDQCKVCEIRHDIYGASDHLPVYADLDEALFV